MTTDHKPKPQNAATLWAEHEPTVRRVLARLAERPIDDPDIEDALSQTVEQLLITLAAGEQLRRPLHWLILIARQRLSQVRVDAARELIARGPAELDPLEPEDLAELVAQNVAEENLDRTYARALGRLPAHQRAVHLAFSAGLSYTEIAESQGVSVGSVNKALQRARKRLRGDAELHEAFRQVME